VAPSTLGMTTTSSSSSSSSSTTTTSSSSSSAERTRYILKKQAQVLIQVCVCQGIDRCCATRCCSSSMAALS
jgi:hypothetical protein